MALHNGWEIRNRPLISATPYTDILVRLQADPQILLVEGIETIEALFQRTIGLLMEDLVCPCNVQDMVRHGSLEIINTYAATEKVQMVRELTDLGVRTLELVGKMSLHRNLPLLGRWARLAFSAVSFANLWIPGVLQPEPGRIMSPVTKRWMVGVMLRDDLCPSPVLRLELLRFAAMWDAVDLQHPSLGYYTASGFMHNALHLSVSRLLPVDRSGLLCVLRKLLYNLHTAYQLGPLVERSCRGIESMQVRQAERVFAYLVVLMGKAAERLRRMRCKKLKSPRNTIEEFSDILQILRLLTALSPNQRLYEMPGMCQLAGGAIATTLRCIVLTPVAPQAKDHFTRLLWDVDDYFHCLGTYQGNGALLDDLRRYHGGDLTFFTERMRQHGCQPVNVPQPLEERWLCVQRFVDSKTKRLMTWPVRLEATGGAVDRSTLLRLMLVRQTDPYTGRPLDDLTYTPLNDLRDEIRAWKRENGSDDDDDDNCSSDGDPAQGGQQQEHDQDGDQD